MAHVAKKQPGSPVLLSLDKLITSHSGKAHCCALQKAEQGGMGHVYSRPPLVSEPKQAASRVFLDQPRERSGKVQNRA